MEKVSASTLRAARTLLPSIASSASRPASRLFTPSISSPISSSTSSFTALRQQCTAARPIRLFSSTSAARYADQPPANSNSGAPAPSKPSSASLMEGLADLLPSSTPGSGPGTSSPLGSSLSQTFSALPTRARRSSPGSLSGLDDFAAMKKSADEYLGEFHLAIYSHKHNTQITLCKPNGDVVVSKSCGHIGFKKSQRKSYDAAYQICAFTLDWLYRRNWHKKIQKMRVSLRGFGQGRDAVQKVLLGPEGKLLRDKITSVCDSTKLKIGGCRSPRPRRLG